MPKRTRKEKKRGKSEWAQCLSGRCHKMKNGVQTMEMIEKINTSGVCIPGISIYILCVRRC